MASSIFSQPLSFIPFQWAPIDNIDYFSTVLPLTQGAPDVVVYGANSCKYIEIARLCNEMKMHKYYTEADPAAQERLSKILIKEKFEFNLGKQPIASLCKATITNLVLTNYLRRLAKRPLIPALFVISIQEDDTLEHPQYLTVRSDRSRITIKELRRVFKLSYKFPNKEIQNIARETFIFVKTHVTEISNEERRYSLERIPAPWEHKDWEELWARREKQPRINPLHKEHRWKILLADKIKKYYCLQERSTSTFASSFKPPLQLRRYCPLKIQ